MIPKIEFRYSKIYDEKYRNRKFIQDYLKEKGDKYPSVKQVQSYVKKVEKLWRGKNQNILKEISKITKLKWKDKKIICYIIGFGQSFYVKSPKRFIQTLTHELIHQIQIQNNDLFMKWREYLLEKYKNETRLTRNHILVSAIHWKVLEKLYNKNMIKEEVKNNENFIDYKRAWEIVEKETPDKIIKKFYEIIKR